MRTRLALACLIAAGLTLPMSPVSAAPKKKKAPPPPPPVCHLLTDERGDGHPAATSALKSDALDITGADVATGRNTIVGVLRVATTDTAMDPMAALSMEWNLSFIVKNKRYKFSRDRVAGAEEKYNYTFQGIPVKDVKENATEIRWTLPRTAVPELKSDKMIKTIAATSGWFLTNADSGSTMKTYKDQTPSCLKPA